MPLPLAALAIPALKFAGGAVASRFAGQALGGLVGGASSRYSRINPQRISGNAFAQGCARQGVGSAVCPVSELNAWANLSRTRYPNAFRTVFEPLLRSERVDVGYLQGLARAYLDKRQGAPGASQAVDLLLGYSQGAQSNRYSRVYL